MVLSYPRVVSLNYRIVPAPGHEYSKGAESKGELIGFEFHLRHLEATFTPLNHYATAEEARADLEPQLRAWQIQAFLDAGQGSLLFKFEAPEIEDAPQARGVMRVKPGRMVLEGQQVSLRLIYNSHPSPPSDFAVNECVEILADLLALTDRSHTMQLYAAFAMTSCVAKHFGGRDLAATALAIDVYVLKRVNTMASTLGKGMEARKHERDAKGRSPTHEERAWLSQILRELVVRTGTVAAGAAPGPMITLASSGAPPFGT